MNDRVKRLEKLYKDIFNENVILRDELTISGMRLEAEKQKVSSLQKKLAAFYLDEVIV